MKLLVQIELSKRQLQAIRHEIREQQSVSQDDYYNLPLNENNLADAGTARAWIKDRVKVAANSLVMKLESYELMQDHYRKKKEQEKNE